MSLEDQLNEELAPSWRPSSGDTLIGVVLGISSRDGGYGAYPIITLACDDGQRWAVHAFHTVLLEELKRVKPQIGHRIGIRYLGKPPGKNYDAYRVATENPPQADWGEDAGAAPPPSQPSLNDFAPQQVPSGAAGGNGDDIPF